LEKSIWEWYPIYYRAFNFRKDKPAISFAVILQCDTGMWDEHDIDKIGGIWTEPSEFSPVDKAKTRLLFGICAAKGVDICANLLSEKEYDLNNYLDSEFEIAHSTKKDKKVFYKVFDLSEFKNEEATMKALQEFVVYAKAKDINDFNIVNKD
jgi:hypothetical protein